MLPLTAWKAKVALDKYSPSHRNPMIVINTPTHKLKVWVENDLRYAADHRLRTNREGKQFWQYEIYQLIDHKGRDFAIKAVFVRRGIYPCSFTKE